MHHDVFISYSSHDKEAALAICHVLEENDIRCWIAPRNIPYGSQYGDVIEEAIKACKVLVVVFSETASTSQWVNGEINVAFEEQKIIIPFRLDQTPLKGQTRVMLNQRHWIDAYPDYKTKFNDLVKAVSLALGKSISIEKNVKPSVNTQITRIKWKNLIVFAGVIAILALGSFLVFKSQKSPGFSYAKDGLKVENVNGLTPEQEEVLKSILENMILVEGGTFTMGNDYSRREYLTKHDSLSRNPHEVKLSKYYISRYELTYAQWEAFASTVGKNNPSGNSRRAIENVTWEEAKSYADKLSEITSLEFSLPTEAQWEYAAKGGIHQKGDLFSGFTEAKVNIYAWTVTDGLEASQEVGNRQPNDLGLYDMTGNVSEWCDDYYDLYTTETAMNPIGPEDKMYRIYRGGDYLTPNFQDMKVTSRYYAAPFVNQQGLGLRLVINIK